MSSTISEIDENLHRAIDIDHMLIFQAEALRQMILNPKMSSKLDPVGTIDSIIENVKKNVELLEEARRELRVVARSRPG
jgi:hypothetical protein